VALGSGDRPDAPHALGAHRRGGRLDAEMAAGAAAAAGLALIALPTNVQPPVSIAVISPRCSRSAPLLRQFGRLEAVMRTNEAARETAAPCKTQPFYQKQPFLERRGSTRRLMTPT
jgi:hypothetical protein